MTDEYKTLLEMAAKAAGLKNYRYCPEEEGLHACIDYDDEDDPTAVWMPHVYDGDTLRLSVQLGLEVYRGHDAIRGEFVEVFYRPRKYAGQKSCIEYHKDHPDQVAATRRAIVRAAAEIGKAMP
jgi:hypothetical protein